MKRATKFEKPFRGTNMFRTKCSIKKEEAIARLLLSVHTPPTRPLLGFLCLLASLPPSMPLSPTTSCSDFSCCSPYTSLLLPKLYYCYTLETHDRQRTARPLCTQSQFLDGLNMASSSSSTPSMYYTCRAPNDHSQSVQKETRGTNFSLFPILPAVFI